MKLTSFTLATALAGLFSTIDGRFMSSMYKSLSQTEDQRVRNIKSKIKTEGKLDPKEYWYEATIDHFTNHGAGSD